MIDEATTPESFKIGQKFENYVREFLFVDNYYDLLDCHGLREVGCKRLRHKAKITKKGFPRIRILLAT